MSYLPEAHCTFSCVGGGGGGGGGETLGVRLVANCRHLEDSPISRRGGISSSVSQVQVPVPSCACRV